MLAFLLLTLYSCRVIMYPFWLGLIVPFVVVHLINWAIYIFIIIIACVVKNRKNVKKSKLKGDLFLILIIGVWIRLGGLIFWQLALNKETDFTFKILFSIFISSQGLLIFLIHVIHAPQSGKQWKKLLIKFYCQKSSRLLLVSC